MKLSISNIAWDAEHDHAMYKFLQTHGACGLEIAPTRIFMPTPYDRLAEAKDWAMKLYETYGLKIPSIQSIWFGCAENIFASREERERLTAYTRKAILFAHAIGCPNLVFGCPRNRDTVLTEEKSVIAVDFFNTIASFAHEYGTVIALEANPTIYNTRFINSTQEAFDFTRRINNPGLKVNLDLGTMIYNQEDLNIIEPNINLISHIHISEPNLVKPCREDSYYEKLNTLLCSAGYDRYISIEMKNNNNIGQVKEVFQGIAQIFNEKKLSVFS